MIVIPPHWAPELGARGRLATTSLRVVNALSRRLGRGAGTVAGGRVAIAVDSDILPKLLADRDLIVVSGTNGKTTTAALVRAALGIASAGNETGANMPAGLVAALASSSSPIAVLEVDEPYVEVVMKAAAHARRRVAVLLNLSRDQLDRHSEVRQLAERWRSALASPSGEGWIVVANVNDPLVAYASAPARSLVACQVPVAWRWDAVSCPVCTRALVFDDAAHGIGHEGESASATWHCECGFEPPRAAVVLREQLEIDGVSTDIHLALPGDFNRANAAMALAAAMALDVDRDDALKRMEAVSDVQGRFALRRVAGRTVRLMLAKNPAGVAALMADVAHREGDLIISINANAADGRDPAWIYDAPFDQVGARRVWCDGARALDVATRLDYAGVATALTSDDPNFLAAVAVVDPIDVVANYTAFAQWITRTTPC